MKAVFALCAVLFATVATAASPFTVCGGWMTDVTVTTKSAFCAGCMSKFSVTGTLPRELVADKYNSYTDIKIFGSSVKNDNVALCNPESPVKCPSPAGTYTWDFEMEFPSLGFSYDAEAKNVWKATDDASDVLLCIDMTAHIA